MITITADKGREATVISALEPRIPVGMTFMVRQINVGDFAISDTQMRVIFERKTWTDLADSIKDPQRKANHDKLLKAREDTNCVICYLIEGIANPSDSRKFSRVPYTALRAFLDHIIIRDNVHVIHCANQTETAETIIRMAKSLSTVKWPSPTPITSGSEEPTPATPTAVLNTKTVITPIIIVERMFSSIYGITCVSYPAVKVFKLIDLIEGSVSCDALAACKYSTSEKLFGAAKAQKIINSAKARATHIKILNCIHGISKIVASNFVTTYGLPQIIRFTENQLSTLVKSTKIVNNVVINKTIGDAQAKKMRAVFDLLI